MSAGPSGPGPQRNPVHEDALWRDRIRNELLADIDAAQDWRSVTEISRERFDGTKYETRFLEAPKDPGSVVLPGDYGHNEFMTSRRFRNPATEPDVPNDRYRHPQTTTNEVGWRKDQLEAGLFSALDHTHRSVPFE